MPSMPASPPSPTRHHVVTQLLRVAAHHPELLERERARAPVERAVDGLECDVARPALGRVAGREHQPVGRWPRGRRASLGEVEAADPRSSGGCGVIVTSKVPCACSVMAATLSSAADTEHAGRPRRLGVRHGEAGDRLVGVEPARVRHHPELGAGQAARAAGRGVARGRPNATRYAVIPSDGDDARPVLARRAPRAARRPRRSSAVVSSSARAVARRTRLVMPTPRATRAARSASVIPAARRPAAARSPAPTSAGRKRLPGLPKWICEGGRHQARVDADEQQPHARARRRSGTSAPRNDSSSARVKRGTALTSHGVPRRTGARPRTGS